MITVKKSMAQETSRWLRRKGRQFEGLSGSLGRDMYLRMVEIAHRLWHGRPAREAPRLSAPVETECRGVPSLDRSGLHQMCHLMPLIKDPGEWRATPKEVRKPW